MTEQERLLGKFEQFLEDYKDDRAHHRLEHQLIMAKLEDLSSFKFKLIGITIGVSFIITMVLK